uniref:Uncharacterized protein n=1 Tax=Megaselia scalaris TaxID=36166 RepID=T1GLA4_MEGSC
MEHLLRPCSIIQRIIHDSVYTFS